MDILITPESIVIAIIVLIVASTMFFKHKQLASLERKTKNTPKKFSDENIGEVFLVVEIDLMNKVVLLQNGTSFFSAPFSTRAWYILDEIPIELIVKGKAFMLVFDDEFQFQELYRHLDAQDLYEKSFTFPKGDPIRKNIQNKNRLTVT